MFNTLKAKILIRILATILCGVIAIGVVSGVMSYTSSVDTLKQTMSERGGLGAGRLEK
ncbi:MAG: hypothetical protein K2N38_03940 [Oscillospiraceae bacterium]|nr:hypothetical protein [Oscillospiraceae bacterium]